MLRISFLLLCLISMPSSYGHAYAETCTIGIVPQFRHEELFETWKPILNELKLETGCEFIWKYSRDIPDFERKLFDGRYDFAYVSPMHVLLANDSHGYTPLVSSGEKKLVGIIVVPIDSYYREVSELEGQKIVFPAPNAVVGSLVLRAHLARRFGINIEPRYVGSHSRVYSAVAKKIFVAGGGVMGTFENQSDDIRKNLRIIHKTDSFMPHAIIAHPRVKKGVQESVRKALLDISARMPELFNNIPMPSPVAVTIDDYNDIRELNLEEFWLSEDK